MGHPAGRPGQHGARREPKQGAKSRQEKTRKGRSPDHQGEKERERKGYTALQKNTHSDGKSERHNKKRKSGADAQTRARRRGQRTSRTAATTHTRRQSGDDLLQATKVRGRKVTI